MKELVFSKIHKLSLVILIIVFFSVSCVPVAAPQFTPVIQTVEVTREVTREVTQEVTLIVEVPVTITPTLTPDYTVTPSPTPSLTPIPAPAIASTLGITQCLFGPGSAYLFKYALNASSRMEVIGRNQDGSWIYIQDSEHKNLCWLKLESVKLESGNVADMPVTDPILLPYSELYTPPQAVSSNRVGNVVTVFWLPIAMPETDYRGYLIEARVCQGGQLALVPVGYAPSFDHNNAMMAVDVTDEPGCSIPSSARIYTVEKHGYSTWKNIPWPAWPISIPTETPTS
jgi:hypothetical protein